MFDLYMLLIILLVLQGNKAFEPNLHLVVPVGAVWIFLVPKEAGCDICRGCNFLQLQVGQRVLFCARISCCTAATSYFTLLLGLRVRLGHTWLTLLHFFAVEIWEQWNVLLALIFTILDSASCELCYFAEDELLIVIRVIFFIL